MGEEDHGIEDLNAGVCVDIDAVGLVVCERLCEGGVHSCAPDFDGDEGVECGDGSLEWLEGGELVGEDAEGAVVSAETYAWWYGVLVWPEPGVALCLLEYPVECCVVSVVVHDQVCVKNACYYTHLRLSRFGYPRCMLNMMSYETQSEHVQRRRLAHRSRTRPTQALLPRRRPRRQHLRLRLIPPLVRAQDTPQPPPPLTARTHRRRRQRLVTRQPLRHTAAPPAVSIRVPGHTRPRVPQGQRRVRPHGRPLTRSLTTHGHRSPRGSAAAPPALLVNRRTLPFFDWLAVEHHPVPLFSRCRNARHRIAYHSQKQLRNHSDLPLSLPLARIPAIEHLVPAHPKRRPLQCALPHKLDNGTSLAPNPEKGNAVHASP